MIFFPLNTFSLVYLKQSYNSINKQKQDNMGTEEIDTYFLNFIANGQRMLSEIDRYSGRISTMTTFFHCDNSIIQFDDIKNDAKITIRYPGTPINKKRCRKVFNNAFILQIQHDNRKVVIKVFRTGLHITGCASFEQCISVYKYVKSKIGGSVVCTREPSLQLLNFVFDLKKNLDLSNLKNVLESKSHIKDVFKCLYDRDTYTGLRVKHSNGGTALIFPSGKIILSGVKNHETISNFDSVVRTCISI